MGGKTTQTTNQKREPWSPAQPALNTALSGALNAYNNTYQGTGVAGMDPLVTQAQDMTVANANRGALGSIGNQAADSFNGILGNGGLSGLQSGAASSIGAATDAFGGAIGDAASYLQPFARGDYVNQRSPQFDQALSNAMTAAGDATNRQFSAAGRYGSGAHSGALGSALGKIATDAQVGEYARQQQNQLGAINSMGNLASAGLQGILGGQGALAGIGQQGITNTGAIAGAVPTLSTAQNADAASLGAVGGQRMDYAQSLIDANNQNQWAKVGNLAQIAGGIGGLGGTMQGTTTTSQNTGLGGIIGGAMAGLGGLSNLAGGLGKVGGWSGMASTLLPFAFSDERLKENIKTVGATFDGQKVYSYNYKGDPTPRMGLMAQEVAMRKPEAVGVHPSGFLMVNYDKALEDA